MADAQAAGVSVGGSAGKRSAVELTGESVYRRRMSNPGPDALSIKSKAALGAVVGVLLMFVLFAALEARRLRQDMQQVIGAQQFTLVSRVADELDDKIRAAHRALIVTAQAVPPELMNNVDALEHSLDAQPGYRSMFDDAFAISADGRVIVDLPRMNRRGIDVHDRDYFMRTMDTRAPAISAPYMGRGIKEVSVMMTAPVRDGKGKVVGMLTGVLHPLKRNFLGKIADARIGETGYFSLFTRDRIVVVSRDRTRNMTTGPAPGVSSPFDHAVDGIAGWEESVNSIGTRGVFSYKPLTEVPWVLYAALPVDEAYAPIALAQAGVFGMALALALLVAPLVWVGTRYLLKPVGDLRDTIREIRGNPAGDARVQMRRRDEIGDLAQEFNAMMEQLREDTRTLAESELRFRKIFDAGPLANIVLDEAGTILLANENVRAVLGYAPEELIGQQADVLTPPRFRVSHADVGAQILRAGHDRKAFTQRELWALRKDGSEIPVEVSLMPMQAGSGPVSILSVADITERRRTGNELKQLTERLEQRVRERTLDLEAVNGELESFSYAVSHDLRTPLRGIDGYGKLLLEEYAAQLGAGGQDYLRRIRKATQRMGTLIDDLLNLSRVSRSALVRQDVDVSALAAEIAAELRRQAGQRNVELDIAAGISVSADAGLMRVALENLLGNAFKYSRDAAQARIEVGATADGHGGVEIAVSDNGAGFDMQFADKLFQPFQRLHSPREFEGTGIGLATVERIVDRHGGRVRAHGEPGKGASFYAYFPQGRIQP